MGIVQPKCPLVQRDEGGPRKAHPDHDDPPDVRAFKRLAEARRRHDHRAVRELQINLRRLGWQVLAIKPTGAGGHR